MLSMMLSLLGRLYSKENVQIAPYVYCVLIVLKQLNTCYTRQCWYGSPLTLTFDERNICRCDKWIEEWISHEKGPDDFGLALFASICWGIWKARYNFVFEKIDINAFGCVAGAMRLVRDQWEAWDRKRKKGKSGEGLARQLIWKKAKWGDVKVNVDASFCNKIVKAAIGIVGRD